MALNKGEKERKRRTYSFGAIRVPNFILFLKVGVLLDIPH